MSSSSLPPAPLAAWIQNIRWDAQGLLPVIAQEKDSKDVLMFAWMNAQALELTATTGQAVYFSRSRQRLWFKGEESGHVQWVHEMRLDCDQDVLLLTVSQTGHTPGIACHTGRHSCFYLQLQDDSSHELVHATGQTRSSDKPAAILSQSQRGQWVSVEPVLKDAQAIYSPQSKHDQPSP